VFNAFLYHESVQQFENMARIGGHDSYNNSTSKTYHDGTVVGASVVDVTGLTPGRWPLHFYLATLGK